MKEDFTSFPKHMLIALYKYQITHIKQTISPIYYLQQALNFHWMQGLA